MSKESRQQTSSCFDYTYDYFWSQIGLAQSISMLPQLREHANNLSAVQVQQKENALQAGFITKIGYKEEAKAFFQDQICQTSNDKEVRYATYDSYYASLKPASGVVDKIALVVVEGEIIDGGSNHSNIWVAR